MSGAITDLPIEAVPCGCWVWRGHIRPDGYGQFGRCSLAHRVVYERMLGAMEDATELHHVCENRACVNPAHLVAVTSQQHRRLGQWRVSECPQGHPYTPENTGFRASGARRCRTCDRHRARRTYYGRVEA